MHSLKNTFIAVGLLGLSFWFLVESRKKGPDLSDEVPLMSVSDGSDVADPIHQFASNGIDAVKSKLGGLNNLEFPDLASQKQKANEFANNMRNEFNQSVGQIKDQANQFADQANQFAGQANQFKDQLAGQFSNKANEFADSMSNSMPSLQAPSTQNQSPANRQLLDNMARDEGLIDALDEQNQWQSGQASDASDNGFDLNLPVDNNNQVNSFNPQPIADSSYNSLATDASNAAPDSDVFRANASPDVSGLSLQGAWPQVDKLVAANRFRDALQILSGYYRDTSLTGPQRQRLIAWLDALAGKVIFSAENHLEQTPYTVGNESIAEISQRWGIPAQLIYNINQTRIRNPAALESGTQLKMVNGPFNAELSLENKMMTMFLGDLYAGRFAVEVGISGDPTPGTYRVLVKSLKGHSWLDTDGNEFPPESPMNGYGPNWIGLSRSLCIHQIADSTVAKHDGCIGLKGKDSKDVFAILGKGSTLTIR